jgi:hypothetical protein
MVQALCALGLSGSQSQQSEERAGLLRSQQRSEHCFAANSSASWLKEAYSLCRYEGTPGATHASPPAQELHISTCCSCAVYLV